MKKKIILVTGASSGIGEAAARRLARAGHVVYGGARRVERMEGLKAEGVNVLSLDVTDDESMVKAVRGIEGAHGAVDVLVNNAGYGSYGALEDVPPAEARTQFEVNVFGLARMSQLVLPGMRKKGEGRIVNVSSIGGRIYLPLGAWYHASKHAVEGLSDCLRAEIREHGIDVVVIQPGGTATEWGGVAMAKLLAASGDGAYGAMAHAFAEISSPGNNNPAAAGVPADAIAVLIQRAVDADRPRTRYVGPGGSALLLLRKWLPDRAYDNLILGTVKRWSRKARR